MIDDAPTRCLQNRRMHLLHGIPQLHPKPTQNILLPRIILGIHLRLHLLVINRTHSERILDVSNVERAFLLPVCEIFAEAVEDVVGFEIPEGLELEPFADVVSEMLHFDFDQGKRTLESIVGEVC